MLSIIYYQVLFVFDLFNDVFSFPGDEKVDLIHNWIWPIEFQITDVKSDCSQLLHILKSNLSLTC